MNDVEKGRKKKQNKRGDKKCEKIELTLRPLEVFLIALPVLFIPLLYIQGQSFRQSYISVLELSQTRYNIDFYSSILKGLHSIGFSINLLFMALVLISVVYLIVVVFCDNKPLKKLARWIKKNGQEKIGTTSVECEGKIAKVQSVLIVISLLFLTTVFYVYAMKYSGEKGIEEGEKKLSSLQKEYSKFSEKQFYTKDGKLLAQGVELMCSKEWCAIYYKGGTVMEIAMDDIGGIQPVSKQANN